MVMVLKLQIKLVKTNDLTILNRLIHEYEKSISIYLDI